MGLRDFHMKWLLQFTQYIFDVPRSSITLDTAKGRIFLVPLAEDSSPLAPSVYTRVGKAKKVHQYHRRMSAYLGLQHIEISFRRTEPKGAMKV